MLFVTTIFAPKYSRNHQNHQLLMGFCFLGSTFLVFPTQLGFITASCPGCGPGAPLRWAEVLWSCWPCNSLPEIRFEKKTHTRGCMGLIYIYIHIYIYKYAQGWPYIYIFIYTLRIQTPPDRIGLRVPYNRNVGVIPVIPFLGHAWIFVGIYTYIWLILMVN